MFVDTSSVRNCHPETTERTPVWDSGSTLDVQMEFPFTVSPNRLQGYYNLYCYHSFVLPTVQIIWCLISTYGSSSEPGRYRICPGRPHVHEGNGQQGSETESNRWFTSNIPQRLVWVNWRLKNQSRRCQKYLSFR